MQYFRELRGLLGSFSGGSGECQDYLKTNLVVDNNMSLVVVDNDLAHLVVVIISGDILFIL